MPAKRKASKSNRKRARRTSKNRKTGGNMIATAAVPFGLLALQRFLHSRRKNAMTKRRR
jgi:hypothetical protein